MGLFDSSSSGAQVSPSGQTQQTVLPDWYSNYAKDILDQQARTAATPYTPYQGPRVADLSDASKQAASLTEAAAVPQGLDTVKSTITGALQRSGMSAASPYFQQAGGASGVAAATPGLQQGAALLADSANPTGINMAQPYLDAAGHTSVDNVGSYMDPYIGSVVDRIGVLGNRNLQENILPGISDQFVGAGGYGGSRQAEFIGRGIRDAQEGISAAQGQALSTGYQGALSASQADLARQGALASTAGNLGVQQQGALATAGKGVADIGSTLGNLTAQQQQILQSLGVNTGNLTNTDTNNQLQGATQLAGLSKQDQEMRLAGAGALNGIGQQQQQNTQANYDAAYADFLRQQGYPQAQIDAMTKTTTALAPAVPSGTTTVGYGPAGAGSTAAPSTLQQIATVLGAIGSFG